MYTLTNTAIVAAILLFTIITIQPSWAHGTKFECKEFKDWDNEPPTERPNPEEFYGSIIEMHSLLSTHYKPQLTTVCVACKAKAHKDHVKQQEAEILKQLNVQLESWKKAIETDKASVAKAISKITNENHFVNHKAIIAKMQQMCNTHSSTMFNDIGKFEAHLKKLGLCGAATKN